MDPKSQNHDISRSCPWPLKRDTPANNRVKQVLIQVKRQDVASPSLTTVFSSSPMQGNSCHEFFRIELELKTVVRLQEIHSGWQLELVERNCERAAKAILSTSVAWHLRLVTPFGSWHARGVERWLCFLKSSWSTVSLMR